MIHSLRSVTDHVTKAHLNQNPPSSKLSRLHEYEGGYGSQDEYGSQREDRRVRESYRPAECSACTCRFPSCSVVAPGGVFCLLHGGWFAGGLCCNQGGRWQLFWACGDHAHTNRATVLVTPDRARIEMSDPDPDLDIDESIPGVVDALSTQV